MHTVELMEQGVAALETLGYGVRQEYLGGTGGGGCEIAGKKWIFIDLALSKRDQLGQVLDTLRDDSSTYTLSLPDEIASALGIRRAA